MEPLLFTMIASLNVLVAVFLGRIPAKRGSFPVVMGILSLAVLDMASALTYFMGMPLDPSRLSLIVIASSQILFLSGYGGAFQKGMYVILFAVASAMVSVATFSPTSVGALVLSLFHPLLNLVGSLHRRPAFTSKPLKGRQLYIGVDEFNTEVLIILSLLAISLSSSAPKWTGIASLLLSSAVFTLIAVRSFSGSVISIQSGTSGNNERSSSSVSMKKELKEQEANNVGKELFDRSCRYMEEKKPYLVESFSMQDLARAMFTNIVYMSKTINMQTGANFKRFVNSYRVSYAQALFRKDPNISLTELFHLSGFANSATFNNAFKAICDESPSSWCRRERLKLLRGKTEK